MQRSSNRILTTHVGSMPRPPELVQVMFDLIDGNPVHVDVDRLVERATLDSVRDQARAGVDVISDGEQSKPSYVTYVRDRFTGFGGDGGPVSLAEMTDYPEAGLALSTNAGMQHLAPPACIDKVALRDKEAVHTDIARFKAALEGVTAAEAFMNAASPGLVRLFMPNRYYPSEEEYLADLAEALSYEYRAIVDAGLILQVDCPDLGSFRNVELVDATPAQVRAFVERSVEFLDAALAGIPPDRVRMHICWGNYQGPHHLDIPLTEMLEPILRARPAGLLIEAANPRHEHEWAIFESTELPDGKVLIPGVIDTTTTFIEHPELVAQRIERYAKVVGRENVIAGTDCGFGTFVGLDPVPPSLVWPKLESLAEGARIASERLWP